MTVHAIKPQIGRREGTTTNYLLVRTDILYRMQGREIILGSQSSAAFSAVLRRFGVAFNGLVDRPSTDSECPLLHGRCRLTVRPSTFELAADLVGEDIFYMPVLLELLANHLYSGESESRQTRTEMSYGITLAFDPESRKSAFERITELSRGTNQIATEHKAYAVPEFRGALEVRQTGACIRVTFVFASEQKLRPARALALCESQLWAGAESLGLVPRRERHSEGS